MSHFISGEFSIQDISSLRGMDLAFKKIAFSAPQKENNIICKGHKMGSIVNMVKKWIHVQKHI